MKNYINVSVAGLGVLFLLFSCNGKNTEEKTNYEESNIGMTDSAYTQLGLSYAQSAQKVLGKNLKQAIKSSGTENAVEFCNYKALSLTDSMAGELNVKLKRVTDKPRNVHNMANEAELKYINAAKKVLDDGSKIKPQLQEIDGEIVAYYPIITQELCLQCHGVANTQIQKATLEKLNNLYPKDMAKDYSENQLRGIWVVEMEKE